MFFQIRNSNGCKKCKTLEELIFIWNESTIEMKIVRVEMGYTNTSGRMHLYFIDINDTFSLETVITRNAQLWFNNNLNPCEEKLKINQKIFNNKSKDFFQNRVKYFYKRILNEMISNIG